MSANWTQTYSGGDPVNLIHSNNETSGTWATDDPDVDPQSDDYHYGTSLAGPGFGGAYGVSPTGPSFGQVNNWTFGYGGPVLAVAGSLSPFLA